MGSAILSAGYVVYLGRFKKKARRSILVEWEKFCQQHDIKVSTEYFTLSSVLSTPVQVQDWIVGGLPADDFSVDNAVLATLGADIRWPLLVDPQQQTRVAEGLLGDNAVRVMTMLSLKTGLRWQSAMARHL